MPRVCNGESFFGASAPRVGAPLSASGSAIFVTAAQSDGKQRDEIVLPYSVSAVVKFLGERETPRKIKIARTHTFSIVSVPRRYRTGKFLMTPSYDRFARENDRGRAGR